MQRPARSHRHLRHRRDLRRLSRTCIVGARRGSPLIVGVGRGRELPGQRRHRHRRPHAAGDLPQRLRRRHADGRRLRGRRTWAPDTAQVQISQLEFERRSGGAGRLPALHAQGDLRAAAHGRERPARPHRSRRGHGQVRRPEHDPAELRAVDRIVIAACGTSWHAGAGRRIPDRGIGPHPGRGRIRQRVPLPQRAARQAHAGAGHHPVGETADTLAGLRESKRRGHKVLAICNVVGSTIAREADGGIYLHAGPEIGVASTKAFTSQVTVLTLLALLMGRIRMLSLARGRADPAGAGGHARPDAKPCWRRTTRIRQHRPEIRPGARTSSSWAASTTSRSPSKARSSSRKSPTSTPRATRRPR